MKHHRYSALTFLLVTLIFFSCQEETTPELEAPDEQENGEGEFYFGADLSYVNQILDHGGVYRSDGTVRDPYDIFAEKGTNLVRLRLWHTPTWTQEVYGDQGTQLYNDLKDVERAMQAAQKRGMPTLLNFHYSDIWADPGRQEVPKEWENITTIEVLADSVYNYTFNTLNYLRSQGLLPPMVQLGNETNCGMMYSNALPAFPKLNVCDGNWQNMRRVFNSGIKAVRDIASLEQKEIQIILHVADPVHVDWWFDNVGVEDFDIIGFSYYPLWHRGLAVNQLGDRVAGFKQKYNKKIMMLETAYPWTTEAQDSYNNLFGTETPVAGFPYTPHGQKDIMVKMAEELIKGGAIGIIYWEPAWISSSMRDLWGQGSAWENVTYFDFEGNALPVFDYVKEIKGN